MSEYYPDVFTRFREANEKAIGLARQQRRLYLAVRSLLRRNFTFDADGDTPCDAKSFPQKFLSAPSLGGTDCQGLVTTNDGGLHDEKVFFASVHGILLSQNEVDPSYGRIDTENASSSSVYDYVEMNDDGTMEPDKNEDGDPIEPYPTPNPHISYIVAPAFAKKVTEAVQQFSANHALYTEVFRILAQEGESALDDLGDPTDFVLSTRQLAEVTSRLLTRRIASNDPQIRRHVLLALSEGLGGEIDGSRSTFDLELPDLDTGIAVDIVASNVRATGMILFSAMLEEWGLHATMEKVVEHFRSGMLPISSSYAGDRLYDWIKSAPQRLSEIERRATYGRVLGLAQGAATDVLPNREFTDLWRRFISNVSLLRRDSDSTNTKRITQEQVHKSARDLAVNLSLHGYGVAHFAAVEMRVIYDQVREALSDPEILKAYGVNDEWQLVDRINAQFLGQSTNGVRFRTMAQEGGNAIHWLADRSQFFAAGARPTSVDFTDDEIVVPAERWLAVTGTSDATIEQLTDPVDLKAQPTLPSFANGGGGLAASVRDTLESVAPGVAVPELPTIPTT